MNENRLKHSIKSLTDQKNAIFKTNQKSYATRDRYKKGANSFIRHLSETYALSNLKNIKAKHINSYVDEMINNDLKPSTIKTNLTAVRFLHSHIDNPRVKNLPTNEELDLDNRIAELEKGRGFTEAEYKDFVSLCNEYDRQDVLNASKLALGLGLRLNEVVMLKKDRLEEALRTDKLSLRRGGVDGAKGGRPREIPLNNHSRAIIREINDQVDRGDFVIRPDIKKRHEVKNSIAGFMNRHREKYQNIDKSRFTVKDKGEEKEVIRNLSFHSFRYNFAQREYKDRIDRGYYKPDAELSVSQILGHNRRDITRRYL